MRLFRVLCALLLAGCTAAPDLLLAADPARTGTDGADGPYGVAALARRYPARISDVIDVTVVYPADAEGDLDRSGAPWPVVAWVHGGFVTPERYLWLAEHLASRGAVVVLPDTPLELAILESGNASAALDGLLEDAGALDGAVAEGGPAWVGGHSLGGVVSSMVWTQDSRFDGLFLAASYPAAGTDLSGRAGAAALALVGSDDGKAPPETVASNLGSFDPGCPLGVVDGLNHYGWTDDASADDLAGDGVATRPVADARADLQAVLDTWSDAVFAGDTAAALAVGEQEFPGVDFSSGEAP